MLGLAHHLEARLPGTREAFRSGTLRWSKAEVIARATAVLDPAGARAAEDLVLGRAGRLSPGALRAAIARAVLQVAPGKARQRREKAARDARVERWPEDSGNAALAGRELPPARVLAADQRITWWARQLRDAGLQGSLDELRARAFLDLLLDIDSRPLPDPGARPPDPGARPAQPGGPAADTTGGPGTGGPGTSGPGTSGPGTSSPCVSGPGDDGPGPPHPAGPHTPPGSGARPAGRTAPPPGFVGRNHLAISASPCSVCGVAIRVDARIFAYDSQPASNSPRMTGRSRSARAIRACSRAVPEDIWHFPRQPPRVTAHLPLTTRRHHGADAVTPGSQPMRSRMVALAMPPPSHMVCRP
jgi:hypothetical protein